MVKRVQNSRMNVPPEDDNITLNSTPNEVSSWFTTKFPEFDSHFNGLNGKDVLDFSNEQICQIIPGLRGSAIYNALHSSKRQSGDTFGPQIATQPSYPIYRTTEENLPFLNRDKEIEKFCRISLYNNTLKTGGETSTRNLFLCCAVQEIGSGKTYFGQHVISAVKKKEVISKKLTREFGKDRFKWLLSANLNL